jgi:His-Xaa-Ser system protein HxsD
MTGVHGGCSCGGSLTVLDSAHVAVRIDQAIYSLEAILRAAYKLSDRCHILLDSHDGNVTAFIMGQTAEDAVAAHVGSFVNELLDQQLRVQLEAQFGPLRTIIAAQAFAQGNLLDPRRENDDYDRDPRGIGGVR